MFTSVLKGHDLIGFVDGTLPCPPADHSLAHHDWHKQDQLLVGWFFASTTEPVLRQVANQTTTRGVWSTHASLFASKSQARLLQLRFELQTMKKGIKTMTDYLSHALTLSDSLAIAGSPILEQ